MEREPTYEHIDTPIKTYEQVALEALVDALFVREDRATFAVLSQILAASREP